MRRQGLCSDSGASKGALFFSIAIFILVSSRSNAADITYHYEGGITSILNLGGPTPPAQLTTLFRPGMAWTLDFTYNAQAPDQNPGNPNIGFYPNSGRSLTFNCGNGLYVGSLSGSQIDMYVDDYAPGSSSADDITMQGTTRGAAPGSQQVQFPPLGGQQLLAISVYLADPNSAALNTDAIPTSLSTMPNGTLFMDWGPSDGSYFYRVLGTISSQTVVVPEPRCAALLVLGICAFACRPRLLFHYQQRSR